MMKSISEFLTGKKFSHGKHLEKAGSYLQDQNKKMIYNRILFSIVSSRYQSATRFLSIGRDQAWKKILIDLLPAFESTVAVDLASGTGDIAGMLSQKYPGSLIIAADQSGDMLKKAPSDVIRNSCITRTVLDMCSVPVKDSAAGIVTGGYALRNAPSLDKALDETVRVLKPGGYAAFLDFSRFSNPVLWKVQYFLLFFWGSLWGILLHGNPRVYSYLAESLAAFPSKRDIHKMIRSRPLKILRSKSLFCGMLELILVVRLPS